VLEGGFFEGGLNFFSQTLAPKPPLALDQPPTAAIGLLLSATSPHRRGQ
jgi:hypothetical protein